MNPRYYIAAAAIVSLMSAISGAYGKERMLKVSVDIGKNIVVIARMSGIPRFDVSKISTRVDYSVSNFPRNVAVQFSRPNSEVTVVPVSYLSIATDTVRSPEEIALSVSLMIDTNMLTTHRAAQTYIENLVHQFNTRDWKRHIEELCPAVTGRSSILDISGNIEVDACGIDPHYRMSPIEWQSLMKDPQRYTWVTDSTLAILTVGYDIGTDGLSYSIELVFEDLKTRLAIDNENVMRKRAKEDARGWNTTAKQLENETKRRVVVKTLEQNALARGDTILAP